MFPVSDIQIEISGRCNAKCPYCITGQLNNLHKPTGKFMESGMFAHAVEFLYEMKYINSDTTIALFNYGEPLLHPEFEKIIDILEFYGNPYEISTNASIRLSEKIIRKMYGLKDIQFSMCGFSQESYNRIHGFSFDKIKDNVAYMVREIHKWHTKSECIMKLQVYSFNEHEVESMRLFAEKLGMTVVPLHALYANLQQQMEFILDYQMTGQLPLNSEQLWYYLPELFSDGIEEETCMQHSSIVIDENLDVAVCCMVTKQMPEYQMCNLFELSEECLKQRRNLPLCRVCMKNGVSKSICKTPSYKKNVEYQKILHMNAVNKGRDIVIIGKGGLLKSFRNMYPVYFCEKNVFSYMDEEMYNFLERSRRLPYWVLADAEFGAYQELLLKHSKKKGIDFLVYNTYLR